MGPIKNQNQVDIINVLLVLLIVKLVQQVEIQII